MHFFIPVFKESITETTIDIGYGRKIPLRTRKQMLEYPIRTGIHIDRRIVRRLKKLVKRIIFFDISDKAMTPMCYSSDELLFMIKKKFKSTQRALLSTEDVFSQMRYPSEYPTLVRYLRNVEENDEHFRDHSDPEYVYKFENCHDDFNPNEQKIIRDVLDGNILFSLESMRRFLDMKFPKHFSNKYAIRMLAFQIYEHLANSRLEKSIFEEHLMHTLSKDDCITLENIPDRFGSIPYQIVGQLDTLTDMLKFMDNNLEWLSHDPSPKELIKEHEWFCNQTFIGGDGFIFNYSEGYAIWDDPSKHSSK